MNSEDAEITHSEFKRLSYVVRRQVFADLRNSIRKRGGFIGGFYTPVESYVLERVRLNLMDEEDAIPDDYADLYHQAEKALKERLNGPGQSSLIAQLIFLPVVGVANVLASLRCPFTIIYDPREKREDRAVAAAVDAYVEMMKNLKGTDLRSDLHEFVLGFDYGRQSENEIGLQIADLVAGEIRQFLSRYPPLLLYGASKQLITPTSYEPIISVTRNRRTALQNGRGIHYAGLDAGLVREGGL